jgi:hypothetical protein
MEQQPRQREEVIKCFIEKIHLQEWIISKLELLNGTNTIDVWTILLDDIKTRGNRTYYEKIRLNNNAKDSLLFLCKVCNDVLQQLPKKYGVRSTKDFVQ